MHSFVLCSLFIYVIFCQDTIVKTISGPIRGSLSSTSNSREFLGIPFASPPINNLRWQNPIDPVRWSQVLNTTRFGPGCPQVCSLPPHVCPEQTSEDCLTLNVFAPRVGNLTTLQPVMVFIHGGHFDQGYSGSLLYEAQRLVEESNIVVVTFNYRLGVLGFLATQNGIKGNFAFQDQLLALKWVQNNIKFFGGDSRRVTLAGQSAGGASVRAHLVSPASVGLYQQAIIQSDPLSLPLMEPQEMFNYASFFMEKIGCQSDEKCLRSKKADDLVVAQKEFVHLRLENVIQFLLPFTFIVDKDILPIRWEKALSLGRFNKVPLIIGTASEDGLLFVCEAINNSKLGAVLYSAATGVIYKLDAFQVIGQYSPVIGQDNKNLFSTLITDYLFNCPSRYMLGGLQPSLSSVYHYVWNHAMSFDGWGEKYPYCRGRVCHGGELAFEFFPYDSEKIFKVTNDEKVLSQEWRHYLTNFVRSSDPNVGLPVRLGWPKWTPVQQPTLTLQTPQNTITFKYRESVCNFWDKMTGKVGLPYLYGFRDLNETSFSH